MIGGDGESSMANGKHVRHPIFVSGRLSAAEFSR
jgi:hypothetical protein